MAPNYKCTYLGLSIKLSVELSAHSSEADKLVLKPLRHCLVSNYMCAVLIYLMSLDQQ